MRPSQPPRMSVDMGGQYNPSRDSQPSMAKFGKSKTCREKVDSSVGRFFYANDIPFNVANSSQYHEAFSAVANFGQSYRVPSAYKLSNPILISEKQRIQKDVVSVQRHYWREYGCTLMYDGWKSKNNRTIVNFLVYSGSGITFLKSVDIEHNRLTTKYLITLFKPVIDDVGPRNIVQLVTDQGSQFKAAGKRLASEYGTFFWVPCAAHILDLILQDMEKFPFVKDRIGEARQIRKFIYNHGWVLARFRQHSAGRNLLRPGLTRFSTNFIAIKSIIDQSNAIESLFLDKEFLKSDEAKTKQARQVKNIISNEMFWTTCQNACIMVGPLLKMIRFLDSDKPTMGYLFHALATCEETIQMGLGSNRNASIMDLIKKRWKSQLSSPLHAALYFLNPYYIFNPSTNLINNEISEPQICRTGVISKMVSGPQEQAQCMLEVGGMRMMEGQFASPSTRIAAQHGDPVSWWLSYGAEYPSLQKIAVKILSQTNTSSGSERNWSVFERIHTKLRNRLLSSRLNDLVYVQYNLKLEQQRIKGKARRHNIDVHDVHSLLRDDNMLDWIAGEDETPVLHQEEQWLNMMEEEAVNNPEHVSLPYNWHDPEVQIAYERLPVSDFVYDFGNISFGDNAQCYENVNPTYDSRYASDRSDHGVQHMNEGYNSNIDNNNEVGNNNDDTEGGYDNDNDGYYDDDTYANEDSKYPDNDDYYVEMNR
ncbi:uncharacterized protein LOC113318494 [Papaver somniferum]|uniref:uncharacterized protein LOC113318494 n=1 Tax=Papaver somniferum TaxID=3469 RepID=UPI000E6FF357|nr:uncharacterized protein LOC113318494 [Papaver somniferum]